ncbi:ABC transporter ATP-binding protein [Clostridium septicum]|uniref:ABC transporter ATP-binding protein n=1 Tax=Clostridium septicum TaxID=1504 RepID=A0ABY5B1N7_CLOSE|nr:ABC transporter ATP-binding protein [Clostridium septicum]UEC20747.1 ABC transporter ATP-binding protein [Clostridium septicum]USS01203.1 ABC transporter ATP-binding protein [Clostridium septicum]WLF69754.1 ABC transporter ATP-binding protein [Clostridium septicum]
MSEIVSCSNVRKIFNVGDLQTEILKGITLSINEGEFVAVVGESGSGKSTFLNILGGLMSADKGEININGVKVDKLNENQLALFRRDNMGFIFQSYNLMPQLSALENVEMPLIFSGVCKIERIKRAKEMLERVGLKDRINHKPSELSGGQQQRVSIARALINNPKLILADEPTGNLDSKTSIEILDLLKGLNKKYNMTFVVVTHSHVVYEYANKIIKMEDGLLCE